MGAGDDANREEGKGTPLTSPLAQSYKVKKPFLFYGESYDAGSIFVPAQVGCTGPKLKILVSANHLFAQPVETGQVGVPVGEQQGEPETAGQEPSTAKQVQGEQAEQGQPDAEPEQSKKPKKRKLFGKRGGESNGDDTDAS